MTIKTEDKSKVVEALLAAEFGAIATFEEGKIKLRTMHFAVDDELNFYLASVKTDPKTRQIIQNPTTSLLIIRGEKGFMEAKEIEAVGKAQILSGEEERKHAFELLVPRSPVVANMKQGGALDLLAVIKIKPEMVKYREVPDIIRGVGPLVLDLKEPAKGWEGFKAVLFPWYEEMRAPFLTASVIPVLLGSLIAWARLGVFNWLYFALTLLGVSFLHLGTNISNDYFDHLNKTDDVNTEYIRPFTGGSRMIQKGLLTPKQVLALALFFFALGSLIGLYLYSQLGLPILVLGLIGVLSGYFYTAPPVSLVNRGFGELFVGLNFGVLVALGSYFVQAGQLAWEPALAAIPVGLLIAGVLYINEFPDYAADKATGKDTLVVKLGRERAVTGYIILMSLIFGITAVLAVMKLISPFTLIIFLILPRVLRAIRVLRLNFNNSLYLIPANADTIMSHLYGDALLSTAYILQRVVVH